MTDPIWLKFVELWWYGLMFHFAMYFPMWLTKAGRWSELWSSE